jgi:hypothetical protein
MRNDADGRATARALIAAGKKVAAEGQAIMFQSRFDHHVAEFADIDTA